MKVKTSITLSPDVLARVDARVGGRNRSEFIESVIREALLAIERRERGARDIEIYARHAAELERDALQTLEDQAELPDDFDITFDDED